MTNNQDLGPAKDTYERFIAMFKWGSVITAVVVGFVILIIS